jgi:trehalose/maltose hydrolase-like predicted phosphorylase
VYLQECWHGEAYRGHIFWDELVYISHFIILHSPQLARSLLNVPLSSSSKAAQQDARDNGYSGAMFPWQSGSNGREESQEIHLNPEVRQMDSR